jgi:hypothetical protein
MTNLVLNAYSGIIEILLWVIVIGSGIALLVSLLVQPEFSLSVAIVGGIAGLLAGFLFCVLFLAPLILLSNMRDQLKEVSDNTSQISGDVKRIRLPR